MAIIASAVIIGGAGLIGAGIASNASKKASQAATQAADQNNALQREIYQQNTGNIQPWMQRGNAAGVAQNALLGLGGDTAGANTAFQNYLNSTDYQFQQDAARRGITGSFAARGLGQSGAALKALQDRSQGIGAGYFGQYLDRLNGINQTGLSGANALAGVGSNYANAVGANNDSRASAIGNSALASAGQINGLLGAGAGALGNIYGQGGFGGSSYKTPTAGPPPFGGYVPGYNPAWQGG